jgi:hypothetical protein
MTLIVPVLMLLSLLAPLFGAEDRPRMKRIDASPAIPDDGDWREPGR